MPISVTRILRLTDIFSYTPNLFQFVDIQFFAFPVSGAGQYRNQLLLLIHQTHFNERHPPMIERLGSLCIYIPLTDRTQKSDIGIQ